MADTTVQYKCPSCGSPLTYNPNGGFCCKACSNEFEEDAVLHLADLGEDRAFDWGDYKKGFDADNLENTNVYVCPSCGATVETDGVTAATTCPYCDNVVVLSDRLSGGLKPNKVIPFAIDPKAAKNAVLNHFKTKKLLPKDFFEEQKLSKIKGIYVPFWLFDAEMSGSMTFNGEKIRYFSDKDYNYIETLHYLIDLDGEMAFTKIPVDGSEKMDDDLMDALEPFHYNALTDFDPAYLSGFLADRFDDDPDNSLPRASARMKASVAQLLRAEVEGEFSALSLRNSRMRLIAPSVQYAMLPVYLLNLTYKNKNYRFAVNGQTGKVVGELPISVARAFLRFLLGTGIGAAVCMAVFFLVAWWGGMLG